MNLKSIPSQRQMRFGEVIRSIISEFLIRGDFFNTEIDISTITVSFVKMSKDLRVASVYFMPLGGKNKDKILQFLICLETYCDQLPGVAPRSTKDMPFFKILNFLSISINL